MTPEQTQLYPQPTSGETTNPLPRKGLKTGWKRVAIGGVSGIMIGSAAAYAATKMINQNQEDATPEAEAAQTDHKMATSVSDDMSFADAFAAAREEVGPGGTFTWHGNVYGTFTADEWNSMSPQEQMDYFADISVQDSDGAPAPPVAESQVVPQADPQVVHVVHHIETPQPEAQPAPTGTSDEGDVQIIGPAEQVALADGSMAYVLPINAYGHNGVIYGTEEPEVAIIDINDSNSWDNEDVIIDIQSGEYATVGEVFVDEGAVYADGVAPEPGIYEVGYPVEPVGQPDYMEDPGMGSDGFDAGMDPGLIEC